MDNLTLERLVIRYAPHVLERVPNFARPLLLALGERLLHLREVREFLLRNGDARGTELLDEIFDRLDVGYSMSLRDRTRIPAEGKLVVVANHPLGGLDGLAVLRAVLDVRPDVRVVANEILAELPGLSELFIPYGVFSRRPQKERLTAIGEASGPGRGGDFLPCRGGGAPLVAWHP